MNQSKFDAAIKENGFDALKALIGTAETDGVLKSITDSLSSLQKTSTTGTVSASCRNRLPAWMHLSEQKMSGSPRNRIASTIGQRIFRSVWPLPTR